MRKAVEESLAARRLRTERDQLAHSASAASLQAERRLREMSVLAGIAKSVAALLDKERLMGRVVDAAVYLTAAQEGCLFVLDEGSGELNLQAGRGSGEDVTGQSPLKVNDSLAYQVVQTGKPAIVSATGQQAPRGTERGDRVRPSMLLPLKVGERVLGVLAVDRETQDRSFTSHDRQLLSALADSAAIALEHTRLRADLRYRLEGPPQTETPQVVEQNELARSASLQGVLDGLEAYRTQVRTCIESARMILTDLREQAVALETRLTEIASPETAYLPSDGDSGVAPAESSDRRLRAILDNIGDGVLVVDGSGKVDLANQAASVMLIFVGETKIVSVAAPM